MIGTIIISVVIAFILGIIVPTIILTKTADKSSGITVTDIKKYEKQMRSKVYAPYAGRDVWDVALELNLDIIEIPDEDVDRELGNKLSMLCPPNKQANKFTNGIIKYKSSPEKNFRIAHEIIHYLKDVGVGNKVSRLYGKDKKGAADKTDKEQIVDYMAAALVMPFSNVAKDLQDEKTVKELCEKYHQSEMLVSRRIDEVRFLQQLRGF